MATKRESKIKDGLAKGVKVDFEEILDGDVISLDEISGRAKKQLHTVNKSIKQLVKNPEIPLGSELVSLYTEKEKLETQLETVETIKEEFLK